MSHPILVPRPSGALRPLALALGTLSTFLTGCAVYEAPPAGVYGSTSPAVIYDAPASSGVVSMYLDPPLMQPAPVMVGWAPPPMLVDIPPPMPFAGAIWIGGYWVWDGFWVWASGRWAPPPRPHYHWVHPYYEHRGGMVVFINGFWAPPGVVFVPPPLHISITIVSTSRSVPPGPRPIGPPGVFVPPPPGSRPGLIVPAPIGTAPAVVIGAPPVAQPGMRIQPPSTGRFSPGDTPRVRIVAPADATANRRPFEAALPAQPHLAAAVPPVVRAMAPPAPRPAASQVPPVLPQAPRTLPPPHQGQPSPQFQPWPPQVQPAPQMPPPAAVQPGQPVERRVQPMPAPARPETSVQPQAPAPQAAPTPQTAPVPRTAVPRSAWPRSPGSPDMVEPPRTGTPRVTPAPADGQAGSDRSPRRPGQSTPPPREAGPSTRSPSDAGARTNATGDARQTNPRRTNKDDRKEVGPSQDDNERRKE